MKIQTIEYYFREVAVSMIRNRWMTAASIGTVAVSLFVLGVFLILVMNINKMAASLESQVQISVYINDNLPEQGRNEIERMTKDLKGVSKVEFVPREEALKKLQERLGQTAPTTQARTAEEFTARAPSTLATAEQSAEILFPRPLPAE